jgi:8-oxo-dGTP diphosphatase/2-hydroxy-dATP diphosphatase
VKEESGLDITDAIKIGYLEFQFENKMNEILEAHIFQATKYHGEMYETEGCILRNALSFFLLRSFFCFDIEMLPKWFDVKQIPYDNMWADDKHWFPLALDNHCFHGHFLFEKDEKTIIKQTLTIVDSF